MIDCCRIRYAAALLSRGAADLSVQLSQRDLRGQPILENSQAPLAAKRIPDIVVSHEPEPTFALMASFHGIPLRLRSPDHERRQPSLVHKKSESPDNSVEGRYSALIKRRISESTFGMLVTNRAIFATATDQFAIQTITLKNAKNNYVMESRTKRHFRAIAEIRQPRPELT